MCDNFFVVVFMKGEDVVDEDGLCYDVVDFGDLVVVEVVIIVWMDFWLLCGWEVIENFLKKWGWFFYGCVEL